MHVLAGRQLEVDATAAVAGVEAGHLEAGQHAGTGVALDVDRLQVQPQVFGRQRALVDLAGARVHRHRCRLARVVDRQQHVHLGAGDAAAVLPQVAGERVQHQHVAVGRQVEQLARVVALEQQAFEDGHGVDRRRPGAFQQRDGVGIVFQRAAGGRAGVPVGRVGVEAPVEAGAGAFVGAAVALALVDLQQLRVGQRALAAGTAQVRHQQVDRRIFLAERDEEVGLLLEVQQFFHRQLARRGFLRHRAAIAWRSSGRVADWSIVSGMPRASPSSCRRQVGEFFVAGRRRVIAQVGDRHGRRRGFRRRGRGLGRRGRQRAELGLIEPVAVGDAVLLAQLPDQRADGGHRDGQHAEQPRHPVAARLRCREVRLQLGGLLALQLAVVLGRLDALLQRPERAGVRVVQVGQADGRGRTGGGRRNHRLLHVQLQVRHARIEHQARRVGGRRRRHPGSRLAGAPGVDDVARGRRRCRRCIEFVGQRHRRALAHDMRPRRAHDAAGGVVRGACTRRRCEIRVGKTGGRRAARSGGWHRRGRGRRDLRQLGGRGAQRRRIGEDREPARETALAAGADRHFDDRSCTGTEAVIFTIQVLSAVPRCRSVRTCVGSSRDSP